MTVCNAICDFSVGIDIFVAIVTFHLHDSIFNFRLKPISIIYIQYHIAGSRSSNEEVEDEEEPEGEDLEDSEEDDDRPKKKKKKERYG